MYTCIHADKSTYYIIHLYHIYSHTPTHLSQLRCGPASQPQQVLAVQGPACSFSPMMPRTGSCLYGRCVCARYRQSRYHNGSKKEKTVHRSPPPSSFLVPKLKNIREYRNVSGLRKIGDTTTEARTFILLTLSQPGRWSVRVCEHAFTMSSLCLRHCL